MEQTPRGGSTAQGTDQPAAPPTPQAYPLWVAYWPSERRILPRVEPVVAWTSGAGGSWSPVSTRGSLLDVAGAFGYGTTREEAEQDLRETAT